MSLEVEYGWLRREPTSPDEIRSLRGIVERSLADAEVEAVSTDLRFIAAFNAALCIATMALRATGHRTVTQAGHHVKTIESVELTLKSNAKIVQKFKTFNNKRNKSVYDVAGAVSDQELVAMVSLANELKDGAIAWLREIHPKLLEG
ncbi:MAG TPA: hypothetical protein VGF19_08070 [Candidatus Acidoferrum sp.]|jgi:hypothetical protein